MKVQVSITEPLILDGGHKASFGMPRFIDSNFSLAGHHSITLRCTDKLTSPLKAVRSTITADGAELLTGELNENDISNSTFSVKLDKPVRFAPVDVDDPFAGHSTIFEQLKTRNVNPPEHLVVVIDSSQAMKRGIEEVISALSKIPSQIDTRIMLAGDKESSEALSREEGIKLLKENRFSGGQDNLFALVKAAERAGESKGGAVLWIHGPQPGYNNEMYIMTPYAATPRFFEMALDDCLTDVNEFFKNHKEVGPFAAIPRTGPIGEDLQNFLSKWQPGANETYMDLSTSPIVSAIHVDNKEASREVSILSAAHMVQLLLSAGKTADAASIGVHYHIVTPVSGAVVLEQQRQAAAIQNASTKSMQDIVPTTTGSGSATVGSNNAVSAPMLQGATNGSVGPVGYECTNLRGINTTGTVRVNNLANMEALLNIFANIGEIAGLVLGLSNVLMGFLGKTTLFPFKLSSKGRIAYGICLATIGLMLPGFLNFLVASARDANMFD